MEITEVRIKLIGNTEDRLRGFCSVTFDDCFVVRDLKIIEGNNGPFVAMPSRKLTSNCQRCRSKNHLRANYCNQCGVKLRNERIEYDSDGRAKLYADVAHPVNARCREMIQNRVVEELQKELERASQPGYASRYDDDYFDDDPGPLGSDEPAIDRPIETPQEAGTDTTSAADTGHTKHHRTDPAAENPQKPHKPDDSVSRDSNRGEDEFGSGIF